jgi:hypothetical protein
MTYVLDERNGWLYAKETTTDYFEPRYIIHWWQTGMHWYQFKQRFADEEHARAAIGGVLHPMSNTSYQDERGWTYRLPNGGQTKPEFTETVPIPEPKQRGRKSPVRWHQGYWQKETTRGWISA